MGENFYKAIIQESSIGYSYHKIILDESGVPMDYEFIEVNPAFEKITGLKSKQIVGKKITEVIPGIKHDQPDWIKIYGDVALNNKKIKIRQHSSLLNSWYDINAYSPQKYYFISLFVDISKEISQSKAIEELFLISPDLICFTDKDGTFLNINKQWKKCLGYNLKDLKNKNIFDIIHKDDIDITKNILNGISKNSPVFNFVNRVRFSFNQEKYRYLKWQIKTNEDTYYWAAKDITDKSDTQDMLKKLISMSEGFIKTSLKEVDYKKISDDLLEISGAEYIAYTSYNKTRGALEPVYFSGEKKVSSDLAMSLIEKISEPILINEQYNRTLSRLSIVSTFNNSKDILGLYYNNDTSNKFIETFNIGQIVVVKITKDKDIFGIFTLMMKKGNKFNKKVYVEIYARQVGLLLGRAISDDKILELINENELIFNSTQDALFLLQVLPNDKFVYLRNNAAFEVKTKIKSKDFIGKTPAEVFGNHDGQMLINNYKRCIKEARPIQYEDTVSSSFGSKTWSTSLTPVFKDGEPVYIVGSKEDITKQKKAQTQISESLKRREILLELVNDDKHSIDALYKLAVNHAVTFSKSKNAFLFIYNNEDNNYTLHSCSDMPDNNIEADEINSLYQSLFLLNRQSNQKDALIINNFENYSGKDKLPLCQTELKRVMFLPIYNYNMPVCTLLVINKTDEYTSTDITSLNLLMSNVLAVINRKKSEDLLKKEKDFFKTTIMSIGDGIVTTDKQGKIIILNDNAQKLASITQQQARGKDFSDVFNIIYEKSNKPCGSPIQKVLSTKKPFTFGQSVLLVSEDGNRYSISNNASPIISENGVIEGAVFAFRDITLEKQKQDSIAYLSYHDQLTGLYNRRFFEEELDRIDTSENLPITVVMADVNGLKLANDAFGHAFGDELLKSAAQVIISCCRPSDIIARIGGDEFVIILLNTDNEETKKIIEKIKKECNKKYVGSVGLSISFGQKTKNSLKISIGDALKKAENKMYHQKLFESPSMRSKTLHTISNIFYESHKDEERHSKSVGRICRIFGQALFFNQREINDLETAGYLHDIGKIALDRQLLNQSADLSEDQWRDIRRHPEVGYRILSSVNELSEIAQYVLTHHEHWDGKGYPKGLKQNEIPLSARIIALADSYDVMINKRSYNNPLSKESAIEQIKENAGTQFDPELAKFFIDEILNKDLI